MGKEERFFFFSNDNVQTLKCDNLKNITETRETVGESERSFVVFKDE
jgi:hypothetical protein